MLSQTETGGGAGQYGFYAVPKAVEPKKKYRDLENDYEDEEEEQNQNPFATLDEAEAANEKQLDRDYYVDEAPYPEFKPKERGLDYGVQIERGDLFDFDLEVRPLIEIMVGRSVVSAINELQEEKEKSERGENLDNYQKKRNAELMVIQRLEAKDKRKNEEAERRRLQKKVYVQNQKEAGKKMIARKNTKQAMLGFKKQLLEELEEAGYLRAETTSDLKIKYEEWLYEKIMESINCQTESDRTAERMIAEEQKRIAGEHQQSINQEMNRRKDILDERERVDRENRERKEKKRYKKWRKKLNGQREPEFISFEDLIEKYEQCSNILKHGDRSNGFSNSFASRNSVYIAGGFQNFLLALIESSGKELSTQEIEELLMKIIADSGKEIEISLLEDNFNKVEEVRKRMEENKNEFMTEKEGQVKDLAQQISLDLSVLEATDTSIKSKLHNRFIEAFLSLYLTTKPEKTEESEGELNDNDKKRLEFARKIVLNKESASFIQKLEGINQILRVRFEILHSSKTNSEASEKKQEKKEEEEKKEEPKKEEEEYVDIFDGEGWSRYAKTEKKELNRADQSAASYGLGSYEQAFVMDERVLHYLQIELQKLTELQGGDKLKQYCENLTNIRGRMTKDVPVYDSEIKWD